MKKIILNLIYNFLAFFSKMYLKRNKALIIWITWSVWKTSCRMIIYQILKKFVKEKRIYTSPKNFNSELWLVFSIFEIEKYSPSIKNLLIISLKIFTKSLFWKANYDVIILEYWIDKPNDMDFLLKVAVPEISIFTKLDKIHSSNFEGSNITVWEEKIKLIFSTKSLVYLNFEDNFCLKNFEKVKVQKKFYSGKNIKASNYELFSEEKEVLAKFFLQNLEINTNILWEENAEYIALGIDILYSIFEKDLVEKQKIVLELQPWRFNIFSWINDSILIDSSYNAWPESMIKMIQNTYKLKENIFATYKIWFVIWDMRELWNSSEISHNSLKKYLEKADLVLTIWEETKKYLDFQNFKYSTEAWKYLKSFLEKNKEKYLILFKWSQNTIFTEEALKEVLFNEEDRQKLVRQDKNWINIKKKFFEKNL